MYLSEVRELIGALLYRIELLKPAAAEWGAASRDC